MPAAPAPQMFQIGELTVGLVPTSCLRQRRTNYRKMREEDFAALKASVKQFGFKSFILVTPGDEPGTFYVIDGHHRWAAAREANLPTVPVVVLTKEQAGEGGIDLAMLSFNVTADIVPDVYLDILKELDGKLGAEKVAEFTGLTSDFLNDLNVTLDASDAELGLGTIGETGTDGSRGTAKALVLPNTEEIAGLLTRVQDIYQVKSAAEAVVMALREVVESRRNPS